jgi:hypothetical protein
MQRSTRRRGESPDGVAEFSYSPEADVRRWTKSTLPLGATPRRAERRLSKMKRCEEKIRYRTAAGATWTLWGIWFDRYLRGRRHRRERRAYACPHCNGWHLTSQAARRR